MDQQAFQKMYEDFSETNKRIWDQWTQTLEKGKLGGNLDELYKQNLGMAEKMVKESLQAEEKLIDGWEQQLTKAEGVPAEVNKMVGQFCGQMRTMLDSRRKLWDTWLKQAKTMTPDTLPNMFSGNDAVGQVTKMWEDFFNQVRDAQQQMLSSLGMKGGK